MNPRAHRLAPVVRLGLLGLVGVAACADGLPVVERIASVRPLAVRVDVEDPPGTDPVMTRAEALAILGLTEGADEAAIQSAYRRLMRSAHPDQGGSDWLAAMLNEARDILVPD